MSRYLQDVAVLEVEADFLTRQKIVVVRIVIEHRSNEKLKRKIDRWSFHFYIKCTLLIKWRANSS